MAATVVIKAAYGGSDGIVGTWSAGLSSFMFRTEDNPTNTDNSKPILIPTAGFNYSYWVHLALDISGTFTQINNIKAYSDGALGWSLGTGGTIICGLRDSGDNGCPMETEYDVATGTEGETGHAIDDAANGHSYYNTQTTPTGDFMSYTSSSPLDLDSSNYTSAGKSKALVLQLKVASDATPGSYSGENITFRYDEI